MRISRVLLLAVTRDRYIFVVYITLFALYVLHSVNYLPIFLSVCGWMVGEEYKGEEIFCSVHRVIRISLDFGFVRVLWMVTK